MRTSRPSVFGVAGVVIAIVSVVFGGRQHRLRTEGNSRALDIEDVAVGERRPVLEGARFVRGELTGLDRAGEALVSALEVPAHHAVEIVLRLQISAQLAEQLQVELVLELLRPAAE